MEHGAASAKPFHGRMKFHDRRSIVKVCKDERDWIDSETGNPYTGFNMSDINMIKPDNMPKFRYSVIVLNDMGDKLKKAIAYYFTEGRQKYSNDCIVS